MLKSTSFLSFIEKHLSSPVELVTRKTRAIAKVTSVYPKPSFVPIFHHDNGCKLLKISFIIQLLLILVLQKLTEVFQKSFWQHFKWNYYKRRNNFEQKMFNLILFQQTDAIEAYINFVSKWDSALFFWNIFDYYPQNFSAAYNFRASKFCCALCHNRDTHCSVYAKPNSKEPSPSCHYEEKIFTLCYCCSDFRHESNGIFVLGVSLFLYRQISTF